MEPAFEHYGNPSISPEEAKNHPFPADEAPEIGQVKEISLTNCKCRLYYPKKNSSTIFLYFHGGGFISCSMETHDILVRHLVSQSGAIALSVGYRLAPKHMFPAAHDDADEAFSWVIENSKAMGINRIVIIGDSAGATLGLHIALKNKDKIAALGLAYPWVDFTLNQDSYERFATYYGMSRSSLEKCRKAYLGESTENIDKANLISRDFLGLPPTLIIAAQCDVLVDEGQHLADAMEASNVKVRYLKFPGVVHDFLRYTKVSPAAKQGVAELARVISTD